MYIHKKLPLSIKNFLKSAFRSKSGTDNAYKTWIDKIEQHTWDTIPNRAGRPLISILVPAYNTPVKYFKPLIQSLINQTYPNWELCVAYASSDNILSTQIRKLIKTDRRIRYRRLQKNLGISNNTNIAASLAHGEFIGLLDHDDILSPHALEEVAITINKYKNADVIYSDEDKLSDDGRIRQLPFFKPNWSPDLFLGVNYINHFLVFRRSLWDKIGGLRSQFDGAQDYDLILRLTEKTHQIAHIPKILYHWRLADSSTAKTVGEKNYADDAGQRALWEAVSRRGIKAEVIEIPERPTNYRLRYTLSSSPPKVSIIIPFKNKASLLRQCVESILQKTTYPNYEIILISNNSIESETTQLLKKLKRKKRCRVFDWNQPFNYSKINNFGVSKASGEYLVFLNNDTEVITPSWLEELIGVASQQGVGAVGPTLYYPNPSDGIQHAGVVVGMGGMAGHVFRHRQFGEWTDFGLPSWPRNYLAVTGACLAISKKTYHKVGGLDDRFIVAGNDVSLCITLYQEGFRNIYWPFASLYHHESVTVGSYNTGIKGDYDLSLKYYKEFLSNGDPYFNSNLNLQNERIEISNH